MTRSEKLGPGIYHDMAAADYHADPSSEPSLSSSIASLLLSATPRHAYFAHPRLNPKAKNVSTKAMDLGSVAHEIVLGKGGGFEVSPFDDYRKKEAREWRDDAAERGVVPIRADDHAAACAMSQSVHETLAEIPGAERAFKNGKAEGVVIWREGDNGPICRAMVDWIDAGGCAIFELKTTAKGISDSRLQALIDGGGGPGFDMQAAFYLRGVETIVQSPFTLHWAFVESIPPFECRVVAMDDMTRKVGNLKAASAIEVWSSCAANNYWPGYPRKIERLDYRDWAAEKWIGEMHYE